MLLSRHHRQSVEDAEEARAAWNPRDILSPKQFAVHCDPSRLRLVDGSRRMGKTRFAAVELLDVALQVPNSKCLFLALTRDDARELVWADILELNEDYKLGGTPNEVRLELVLPNGSVVRCGGAKDRRQAERRRGRFYALVIIDECQLFPSHLRDLVEQILKPALLGRGRRGRIVLMGTPAQVPGVGYWEQQVRESLVREPANDNWRQSKWSRHQWTVRDNPYVEGVEEFLQEMADAAGGWDAPSFRREYLGERPAANDNDRPFAYDAAINDFSAFGGARNEVAERLSGRDGRRFWSFTRWHLPLGGKWRFTFGIDLGSRAASAIAVLGTTDAAPGKIWLVEEFLSTRMLPDKLREKIDERRAVYKPNLMAVDEGALGDMIADGWRAPPYLLPVVAAEKWAPEVTADFVSAAMSRGDFFIPAISRTAEDMAALVWDDEYLQKSGKRRVAKEPHSDVVPAVRYAFKDANALAQATRPPKIAERKTPDQQETADEIKQRRQGARASTAARTGYGLGMMRGQLNERLKR